MVIFIKLKIELKLSANITNQQEVNFMKPLRYIQPIIIAALLAVTTQAAEAASATI